MTASDSLENHFRDQLAPLGGVTSKRMFGAFCLFKDGKAFAIVDDGTLFLKSDAAMKEEMKAGGGKPFTYAHKEGHRVEMSYCSPPEAAFDDVDELRRWARRAIALATAPKSKSKAKAAKNNKAAPKKKPTTVKAAKKKKAKKKKKASR